MSHLTRFLRKLIADLVVPYCALLGATYIVRDVFNLFDYVGSAQELYLTAALLFVVWLTVDGVLRDEDPNPGKSWR